MAVLRAGWTLLPHLGGWCLMMSWIVACGLAATPGVEPASPSPLAPPSPPASPAAALVEAFPPPAGFVRAAAADGSFEAWLRARTVAPGPVLAWDGAVVHPADDPRVAAIVTLDLIGDDLQQCADTAIRLHAEWLWDSGRADEAGYAFTSGHLSRWSAWRAGYRPQISGNKVGFLKTAAPAADRASWRGWLTSVFTYAGTRSLDATLDRVAQADARAGDLFVQGGGPGHAVILLDVAEDGAGHRVALIGQGFMPAQSLQVLRDTDGDAWFSLDGAEVQTPFWAAFGWDDLRRF